MIPGVILLVLAAWQFAQYGSAIDQARQITALGGFDRALVWRRRARQALGGGVVLGGLGVFALRLG